MYYDFFQNSQRFSVKRGSEPISYDEAIVRFYDIKEIQSFFNSAMRNHTDCRAVHNIAKDFIPSNCCRPRKNRPLQSNNDRFQSLYSEISGGNVNVVLKSDNLKTAHPKNESISETGTTNFEKLDFLSVLNKQAKELKAAFSKIVHADYSILENVYYFDEHSTDYAPVTLDLSSVQEHSTGWKKWDDPFEISALGAFKAAASYTATSFLGLSESIKAAVVLGSQTELISAEYYVTGKSILRKKWYGSYAIRYNIRTLHLEVPWIKYKGSGPSERTLVELKRKDRLVFAGNKIYNHPETMIPPFHSMDKFIADYKNGLVLPDHDTNKPIILSKR
jgi:hypothetical protein